MRTPNERPDKSIISRMPREDLFNEIRAHLKDLGVDKPPFDDETSLLGSMRRGRTVHLLKELLSREPVPEGEPQLLLPPKWCRRFAYHHWVDRIDSADLSRGMEIYQWQPQAQKWCRPNQFACGMDFDLIGYRWVAICPTPPFEQEVEEFRTAREKLRFNQPLTDREQETYDRLIIEHITGVGPR